MANRKCARTWVWVANVLGRTWKQRGILLVVGFAASALYGAPIRLRVEQRVNPLGIDEMHPTFSWQSDATEPDWKQSGYRILVASSANLLAQSKGDVWDSGRMESSESVNVAYGGVELKSRQRYFWTVAVWDAHGKMERAANEAWWEMGLLQPGEWSAAWIRRRDPNAEQELRSVRWIGLPEASAEQVAQPISAEFSYKFHLDRRPLSAMLHVLAPGAFTTRVNDTVTGHKVAWNSFDFEDVRDALVYGAGAKGDNTIVVSVSAPASRDKTVSLPAALAAVLRLDKGEGEVLDAVSDGEWFARRTGEAGSDWSAAKELGGITELRLGTGMDRLSRAVNPPQRISTDASLFRKEFVASDAVVSARLYITALGSYKAFINGKPIGGDALTPGFTNYRM